jgi:carboxyl-terminal processing protease
MVPRRTLRAVAAVAVVAASFVAGAASMWLAHSREPAPSRQSVVDEAEARIATDAAHPVSQAQLERAAVQGMLAALDDQWSAYYAPADYTRFEQVLAGSYTGVGVWIRRAPDGTLRVLSIEPASPAAKAGLQRGDAVVAVGGLPTRGRSVADVVSALRGDAGSRVTVVVARGARQLTVHLRRAAVDSDDVSASMVTPNVERLRVSAFTRGVGRWMRASVADAERRHLRGLLLDLRGNPGGLLDEAVETSSAFLDGGPVVTYEQRGHAKQVLNALGAGNVGIPLVVLVDGGTASAAEIVAGALQDRGRAVIIGSRTFGKGSVQAPSQLSDGSALELTVGHYLTPSGRSLDGVGIVPDLEMPATTPAGVIVERAVEVLSGLTADAGSSGRG